MPKVWFLALALAVCACTSAPVSPENSRETAAGPFTSSCLRQAEAMQLSPALCEEIRAKFFHSEESMQALSPAALGASPLPIDEKTKIFALADPKEAARIAYCFFEFRGWFDPKEVSPETIAMAASGFAILAKELKGYPAWQKKKAGLKCAERVLAFTGKPPASLSEELHGYAGMIAVNPVAAIQEGRSADDVRKDALLTINHERIHVLHVLCPALDRKARKLWASLPRKRKKELREKFNAYDWSKPEVAVREHLALMYEEDPIAVLSLARCKY